jgi:hypothetical protein
MEKVKVVILLEKKVEALSAKAWSGGGHCGLAEMEALMEGEVLSFPK